MMDDEQTFVVIQVRIPSEMHAVYKRLGRLSGKGLSGEVREVLAAALPALEARADQLHAFFIQAGIPLPNPHRNAAPNAPWVGR